MVAGFSVDWLMFVVRVDFANDASTLIDCLFKKCILMFFLCLAHTDSLASCLHFKKNTTQSKVKCVVQLASLK